MVEHWERPRLVIVGSNFVRTRTQRNTDLACSPRHFVRMRGGPHNKKVVHSFDLLLYMLTIRWVVDDMALAYSQQLAILLTMLLDEVLSALDD